MENTNYKNLVNEYVDNFDTILIIGAKTGLYPMLFADQFKNVLAYEFDIIKSAELRNNCSSIKNITRHPYAFYNVEKFLTFILLDHMGVEQPCNVKTLTIDSLMPTHNIDCIMINIKVDQKFILLGAIDTIRYRNPLLIIKKNPNQQITDEFKDLCYNALAYRIVHENDEHIFLIHCSKL